MSSDSFAADPELADRLLARTSDIVARSLDYMPRDAFWGLRYAERAKRFANEDGAFHVRYLADAVRAGSPTVMAEYARWLRDLLVPRGMCTLHLAEHLDHIGRAVEHDTPAAVAYVRAGIDALRYEDGVATVVQTEAPFFEGTLSGPAPPQSTMERNSAWETRYLCHYVADAMKRGEPALLSQHVAWARGAFLNQGGTAALFDQWLSDVDSALSQLDVPAEFRTCPSSGI